MSRSSKSARTWAHRRTRILHKQIFHAHLDPTKARVRTRRAVVDTTQQKVPNIYRILDHILRPPMEGWDGWQPRWKMRIQSHRDVVMSPFGRRATIIVLDISWRKGPRRTIVLEVNSARKLDNMYVQARQSVSFCHVQLSRVIYSDRV